MAGIINSALQPTTAAIGGAADPANAGTINTGTTSPVSGGATPTPVQPTPMPASGTPNTGVTTVASQLPGLMSDNSPIIQQAMTGAKQQMNERGMLNSSMATTAGQSAAYNAAIPIATADASSANNLNLQNNQGNIDMTKINSNNANAVNLANIQAGTSLATANISADTQKYLSNQSAATQTAVASMNNDSQARVAAAHDANSVLLANNSTAQSLFSTYMQDLASIDTNNAVADKATAKANVTAVFNEGMAKLSDSGVPNMASGGGVVPAGTAPSSSAIPNVASMLGGWESNIQL